MAMTLQKLCMTTLAVGCLTVTLPQQGAAGPRHRDTHGNEDRNYEEILRLRDRVADLEDTVRLLERTVNEIRADTRLGTWTCMVSAFTDTFVGSGTNRMAAKAQAVQACTLKHHPMHCDDIQCDEKDAR